MLYARSMFSLRGVFHAKFNVHSIHCFTILSPHTTASSLNILRVFSGLLWLTGEKTTLILTTSGHQEQPSHPPPSFQVPACFPWLYPWRLQWLLVTTPVLLTSCSFYSPTDLLSCLGYRHGHVFLFISPCPHPHFFPAPLETHRTLAEQTYSDFQHREGFQDQEAVGAPWQAPSTGEGAGQSQLPCEHQPLALSQWLDFQSFFAVLATWGQRT